MNLKKLIESKIIILCIGILLGAVTVFGSTYIGNKISDVYNNITFSTNFEKEIDIFNNHLQNIETEDFIFAGLWLNEDNQGKLRTMSSLSKEEFDEYIENHINPIYSALFSREISKININWAAFQKTIESAVKKELVVVQKMVTLELDKAYKNLLVMLETFDKQIQEEIKKFLDENKEAIEIIEAFIDFIFGGSYAQ